MSNTNSQNDNFNIVWVKDLLDCRLSVPDYQRPYKWSAKSALTLFNDIYQSHEKNVREYRLGTIILYQNNENGFEIVDGQQRITTLLILLYALDPENEFSYIMRNLKFKSSSFNAVKTNYEVFRLKLQGTSSDDRKKLKSFILEKCSVVKIITCDYQEAFQFFDSQNSRGKSLDPHDLLKAYHLREMDDDNEKEKIETVACWEGYDQKKIAELFRDYLYPMIMWYKQKSGLYYSQKNIDTFKGIKIQNQYDYGVYAKAANLYIEKFAQSFYDELTGIKFNQHQLMQPLIAGKRFFSYTVHYLELLERTDGKVEELIEAKTLPNFPRSHGGDMYIYNMFLCALMFFADRFGEDTLTDHVILRLFQWAYSLRLSMLSVYQETVNKYALGRHEKLGNKNIFEFISSINEPAELDLFELAFVRDDMDIKEKYAKIYDKIKELQGEK